MAVASKASFFSDGTANSEQFKQAAAGVSLEHF
jgi:hypothetical protein